MQSILLHDLGALRLKGADARRFLQGQVSADVTQLAAGRCLLAGYHNPQGRVIALLRLIERGPEEILAVLPRELAPTVAARLAKYILRAKVTLTDISASVSIHGLVTEDESEPPAANSESTLACVGVQPARWLLVTPAAPAAGAAADGQKWRELEVAAGEPQVYSATSEEFVAQMLNLDVLGAIAFDKGCYTGQEVIARAHYRGRVKRRMQRFVTPVQQELVPGSTGRLADGRSFKVVQAVKRADGTSEFLAVTALAAREEAQQDEAGAPLAAQQVSLPYTLPE
jgi:tRNA-modifying protein YgfZ